MPSRRRHRTAAACAALTLWLLPHAAPAMELSAGLQNLRCVDLHVDLEQDPVVESRARMTEQDLQHSASKALKAALPLLSISPQCGNRLRLLLVLHDRPGGYNGLLVSGIERVATVLETGVHQEVEVWSGGIQEFRGPIEGATHTARQALARSLDHFAEAYRLSGNP